MEQVDIIKPQCDSADQPRDESGWKHVTLGCLMVGTPILVGTGSTTYMGIASLAYCLMFSGVLLRHRRRFHVPLMLAAISIDLLLVLLLEIQRDAVKTALSFSLSPLQQAHILASSLASGLYFPVLGLGLLRYFGKVGVRGRNWHVCLGGAAFIFRTLGFLLMFSLLAVKKP